MNCNAISTIPPPKHCGCVEQSIGWTCPELGVRIVPQVSGGELEYIAYPLANTVPRVSIDPTTASALVFTLVIAFGCAIVLQRKGAL